MIAASGNARRLGTVLMLKTISGAEVILPNDDSGCPKPPHMVLGSNCVTYTLVADLPSEHLFVVAQLYYEGGGYLLIDDRSGSRLAVPAVPQFAPDHSAFARRDIFLQEWERIHGPRNR